MSYSPESVVVQIEFTGQKQNSTTASKPIRRPIAPILSLTLATKSKPGHRLELRARCAVYARFSSERQSPTSIDDQVPKCREQAERNEWEVLERHLYVDEPVSGVSTERDGLEKLLAAASHPSRPFDCILIDDSSRLTRRLADALNLYERLAFSGIRVVAVSQGVDTENPQAELLIGVHGLIDADYWRELGQKTHRGM